MRPVRRAVASIDPLAAATAARRLVKSFPYLHVARGWGMGPLQCHRGRRSRHAAGTARLSKRCLRFDDTRGSAGRGQAVGQSTHALVQRLAANMAGAHALAGQASARTWIGRVHDASTRRWRDRTCRHSCIHSFLSGWHGAAVSGDFGFTGAGAVETALAVVYGTTFVAGYVATFALSLTGLARRNLLAHARALVLIPVLWLLLSLAAWRALFELFHAPYRWDKTEHGLARTSPLREA